MKSNIRKVLSASLFALALGAGGANAMVEEVGTSMNTGNARVDRDITIDSSTRWINVTYGETVRITASGGAAQAVIFRFDGNASFAHLSDIAPKLAAGKDVAIYLNQSANPLVTSRLD